MDFLLTQTAQTSIIGGVHAKNPAEHAARRGEQGNLAMASGIHQDTHEVNTWQSDARAVLARLRRRKSSSIYDTAYDYYLARGLDKQDAEQNAIILECDWDEFIPPRAIICQSRADAREAREWAVWQHDRVARAACRRQAQQTKATTARAAGARARARRSPAARQAGSRRGASKGGENSGSSGSGDGDPDPDPEPEPPYLLDYHRLAFRWAVSPRTLANQFSRDPASLPVHILVPGARGPRWRLADIEAFEAGLRQQPDRPPRKRGRPRIAGGRG